MHRANKYAKDRHSGGKQPEFLGRKPRLVEQEGEMSKFADALKKLIVRWTRENAATTEDYILINSLLDYLDSYCQKHGSGGQDEQASKRHD